MWATHNVGATLPEEYGDYFAWGETQTKAIYNWRTYRHCDGDYGMLTKYCTRADYGYNGFVDNLTVLEPEDDAATANYGGRIPHKRRLGRTDEQHYLYMGKAERSVRMPLHWYQWQQHLSARNRLPL